MTKKGYFVSGGGDGLGFAVIADGEVEAKITVREAGWLGDCNNIECLPLSKANIKGLPLGMVQDARDALCRGLYDYLSEHECDECGEVGDLECHEGRALCEDCLRDAINGCDEE